MHSACRSMPSPAGTPSMALQSRARISTLPMCRTHSPLAGTPIFKVHIPDKHDLMREVFRVLKPGGRYWRAKSLRE